MNYTTIRRPRFKIIKFYKYKSVEEFLSSQELPIQRKSEKTQ
jgi:hypothetical protein